MVKFEPNLEGFHGEILMTRRAKLGEPGWECLDGMKQKANANAADLDGKASLAGKIFLNFDWWPRQSRIFGLLATPVKSFWIHELQV